MRGLLWAIVGSVAVLPIAALYPIGLALIRQRRQNLMNRFGQLGSQLEERIGEESPPTEESAAKTTSERILQMVRESESQPDLIDQRLVAWPLNGIGNVFTDQGHWQQAIGVFSRSLKICQKKTYEKEVKGFALFGLARSLAATKGGKGRAINLEKQAREIFGETPKAFDKELKEVDTWLQEHMQRKLVR